MMNLLKKFKRLKYPDRWDYPECDHLNMALMELLKEPQKNEFVNKEIYYAIFHAHGYFYDCVANELYKNYGIKVRGEII